MTQSTYMVRGVTCEHCVRTVTEEVSKIDGVDRVVVDLPTGAVTVTSKGSVDDTDVRVAVEEAGYELAPN